MTGIVECTECKRQFEHIETGDCPACKMWEHDYKAMELNGINIGNTGHAWHTFCVNCNKITLMRELLVD